jgi:hypothetical protein
MHDNRHKITIEFIFDNQNHDNPRVPLVEQERLTLPEQLSLSPVVSGVRVTRSFVLSIMFCRSLFVLFLLAIVLSLLLRFMDSDYPFGIFKHF